ncbi:hypothetical protein [Actinomarinicola tropica]|uniref:Uncharacterized protein n=1 Tax=Actinomarinicola tropica TaxID=2789776 RepID=A0A5Q2RHZ3_9ACTN|nr:hypothetical protein [Actinomarinicola tropica]QGG96488.1 hypothetical protein GH723_16025 [Actinomarinicola tropica]
MRGSVGRWRGGASAVGAVVLALAVSACVGVTDREDFDALVDARGGGVSSDLALDAIAAVETRVGTDDLEMTSLSINPGNRSVVLTVRDPAARQNLDRYVYRARGGLGEAEPVQVSARDDLDAQSFRSSELTALDDVEGLADAAVAALDLEQASVESIVATVVQGEANLIVAVDSARARGSARFRGDGSLVEASRS